MIFAIQLNYNKVSNFLVTYVVSTKFILFSLLKIYVTTPLHMGLINFKIIGKINIAFVFSCIQISFISLFIYFIIHCLFKFLLFYILKRSNKVK